MDTEETPFNFDAWWEIHGRAGHQDIWKAAQEAMRTRAAEVVIPGECTPEEYQATVRMSDAIRSLPIE